MLKQTYARRVQPEVPARLAVVSTKNRMVAPHAGGDFTAPSFCYEPPPPRWGRHIGVSVALHAVVLVVVLQILALLPKPKAQPEVSRHFIPLILPTLSPPPEPAPTPMVAQIHTPPKPAPVPPPVVESKVEPPPVEPPRVEPKPEPPVQVAKLPEPEVPKPAPPKKREVVLNQLNSGSSAPPTVKEPKQKVQTGGFGDPYGVPGQATRSAPVTIAHVGSFDLPPGPGTGNGTGGAHGVRGTVASTGFGNGVATPVSSGPKGTVASAGFGEMPTSSGPRARAETKPAVTPVEILFKPRPVYTEEARKLRVEGEVLLEVMFTASGELKVQKVVRSLGHGLDEAALHAAERIRFKPASRDGQPYDSVALVHINFELAE